LFPLHHLRQLRYWQRRFHPAWWWFPFLPSYYHRWLPLPVPE
jgi:hypothetical protein